MNASFKTSNKKYRSIFVIIDKERWKVQNIEEKIDWFEYIKIQTFVQQTSMSTDWDIYNADKWQRINTHRKNFQMRKKDYSIDSFSL